MEETEEKKAHLPPALRAGQENVRKISEGLPQEGGWTHSVQAISPYGVICSKIKLFLCGSNNVEQSKWGVFDLSKHTRSFIRPLRRYHSSDVWGKG